MSEIKTRIENATAELATATQTIHDLPDYPDLENIYGDADITVLAENVPSAVASIYVFQEEDDYIIYSYHYYYQNFLYKEDIYKYNKNNGTHTLLYTLQDTSSYITKMFVHYYDNKIYYNEQQYGWNGYGNTEKRKCFEIY